MNKILVFLADSCCSPSLREGVCIVLDSLPVYQPLLVSLTEILNETPLKQLTEAIDAQLFPTKAINHTVEQTRYALTVCNSLISLTDHRTVSAGADECFEMRPVDER